MHAVAGSRRSPVSQTVMRSRLSFTRAPRKRMMPGYAIKTLHTTVHGSPYSLPPIAILTQTQAPCVGRTSTIARRINRGARADPFRTCVAGCSCPLGFETKATTCTLGLRSNATTVIATPSAHYRWTYIH